MIKAECLQVGGEDVNVQQPDLRQVTSTGRTVALGQAWPGPRHSVPEAVASSLDRHRRVGVADLAEFVDDARLGQLGQRYFGGIDEPDASNGWVGRVWTPARVVGPWHLDPLVRFLDDVAAGRASVPIHRTYRLDEIAEAHADMEAGRATGKLVVIP